MFDPKLRPEKIYFEVTNACNFHCEFCPSDRSARARRHMDFALFCKGIDEISREEITDKIGFHILGEPLLYPQIYEAVKYVRSKGLRAEINTNGSLLTRARVERLLQAGVSMLAISVQMIGADDHLCRGAKIPFEAYYQTVLDAVRHVQASQEEVNMVLCFMNPSLKKLFDIDEDMHIRWGGQMNLEKLCGYIHDLAECAGRDLKPAEIRAAIGRRNLNLPQSVRIHERLEVFVHPVADWGNAFTRRKVFPAKLGFCGYALTNVGVLNNGDVTICCPDYDGKTALGNLNERSLSEMLASDQAERIRKGFSKMQVVHPYCQRCIGSTHPLKALIKGALSVYLFKLKQFSPTRLRAVNLFEAARK